MRFVSPGVAQRSSEAGFRRAVSGINTETEHCTAKLSEPMSSTVQNMRHDGGWVSANGGARGRRAVSRCLAVGPAMEFLVRERRNAAGLSYTAL